jgi:hypothetical protein
MSKLPRLGKPKSLKKPASMPKLKRRSPIKATPAPSSSHVASTSFDPDLGHLTVDFGGGRRYRYSGVSKETAESVAADRSTGSALHRLVIGKHDAVKI